MPTILNVKQNTFDYLGRGWTSWPPYEARNGLNIVEGVRKISHDIISVCLTKKGENPIHPDLGLAPNLFDPLSDYDVQYWRYNAQREIIKWVAGIDRLSIEFGENGDIIDYKNQLETKIYFVPKVAPDVHTLTFGYYSYQGAIWEQNLGGFLNELILDGDRFMVSRNP